MGEWKELKLADVAEITSSKRIFVSDYVSSGIPFYRSKEIIEKANGEEVSTELFITENRYFEIKEAFGSPLDGDLLIAAVGERAGIPYFVSNDGDFYFKDGNLIWFRNFKKDISSRFLLFYFKSYVGQQNLEATMIGSAQKALTIVGLKNLEVRFPSYLEQQAIASILSSLDDKLDLLKRQNKTLEALAETLFRHRFVEEAEDSWREVRVRDVCKTITKGTTPTTLGNRFTETGINFLKAESLTDQGDLLENKFSFIDLATHEKLSRSRIEVNDLIITIAGTIGRVAIIPARVVPANTNQAVAILRVAKNTVSPVFLYCLFKSTEIRNDFESRVVHAVQPNLSLGEIGDISFKLPPRERLEIGQAELALLFQKKERNNVQIRTLTRLRDALLPKLMSGEVRIEVQGEC